MGMFFLDVTEISATDCGGMIEVVRLIVNVIKILQWLIPIGLILFGLLDLGKAVIAGKEDEMKKFQSALIKRVIYAVLVFLVVTIVYFATGMVGGEEWRTCYEKAGGAKVGGSQSAENRN